MYPDPMELLSKVTVDVPCSESWEAMKGDKRVRSCAACQKNVYDLTNLRTDEIAALFLSATPPCVRFYRRPDGRIATADCRLTWENVTRRTGELLLASAPTGKRFSVGMAVRYSLVPLVALGVAAFMMRDQISTWLAEDDPGCSVSKQVDNEAKPLKAGSSRKPVMGATFGTRGTL